MIAQTKQSVATLTLALTLGGSIQEVASLKILIVAGEDSINIVQQNTATAPIVEIRDRNDQPVAGAVVRFTVRGGRNARLNGGLRTLQITTDNSGRAIVSALTPTGSGAVQIDIAASFQGQAVSATITQTNVATAAQAASASSAGAAAGGGGAGAGGAVVSGVAAAGGAAAAGGGLSTTALATILGGVGVAGGLAAIKVAGTSSPSSPTTTTTACTFSVSPTAQTVSGAGGSFAVAVSAQPAGCSPASWTAFASAPFVTISPTSGSGDATVTVTVAANTSGGQPSAALTIAGRPVIVVQDAGPTITDSFSGRTDLRPTIAYEAFFAQPSFTVNLAAPMTYRITFSAPPDCIVAFGSCPGAPSGSFVAGYDGSGNNSCYNGRGIVAGSAGSSSWTDTLPPGPYTVFLYVQYGLDGSTRRTGDQCQALIGSVPFSGTVTHR